MSSSLSIGIVGGGPGGLMTAWMLDKFVDTAFHATIFEASDRVGGKILTPQFSAAPVRYEAGAAEFYDYSHFDDDPLRELVRELGLPVFTMGGPAVVMDGRTLDSLDDIQTNYGDGTVRALQNFDRQARDLQTPLEFYHSDDPEGLLGKGQGGFDELLQAVPDTNARRYLQTLIHSDLAAEPHQTNLNYGLQNYLMNDPAYMGLYGIEGGNERLPRELARRISADVLLQHTVQSVDGAGDRVSVTFTAPEGEASTQEFDYVIVALPHNQLESVGYPDQSLRQDIQQHIDHYNHPAHYLRMTLLFREPFWRQKFTDFYWMTDAFDGCCVYDQSLYSPGCPYGVLGWLLGGDEADRLSHLDDEALIDKALDSMPAFVGDGRSAFLEGRVHRWIRAVNAMPGGTTPRPADQRHRPSPDRCPGLMFVGDYLYDSTLNGVMDSAWYVAAWIAAENTAPG